MQEQINQLVIDVNNLIDTIYNQIKITPFGKSGKRNRTRFLAHLLSSRIIEEQYKRVVDLSAAVELIHEASLIVDDIIDESSMRRGKKALHKKVGVSKAILISDFLIVKSSRIFLNRVGSTGNIDLCNDLLSTVEGMICSELEVKKSPVSYQAYDELLVGYFSTIKKKTSTLFEMCALLAQVLQATSTVDASIYRQMGAEFGVLYQLRDDIQDCYASKDVLGKEGLSDVEQNIITLPVLLQMKTQKQTLVNARQAVQCGKGKSVSRLFYEDKLQAYLQMLSADLHLSTETVSHMHSLLQLKI